MPQIATVDATKDDEPQEVKELVDGMAKLARAVPCKYFDDCDCYKMDHPYPGVALIINNRRFKYQNERFGSDADAARLEKLFQTLEFNVVRRDNQTADEIRQLIATEAKSDHSLDSCFVCVVLSHGDEGVVWGTDDMVKVDEIVEPFKRKTSLAGKPKIFIFQACRGDGLMDNVEADSTAEPKLVTRIPAEADFLYAYSTVPGYFSWRNSTHGSWFVQAFCETMERCWREKDLMEILTIVNRRVAFDYESFCNDSKMTGRKQVPSFVSTLTKKVVFCAKSELVDKDK